MKLGFLPGKKFIMSIGDDGSILTLVDKNKLEARIFSASASPSDRREMHTLLTQHPTVPIYILLDSIEQTYTKQILPGVGALSVGKLVNKRLERDFAKTDIKGAAQIGREKTGRRDWIYMLVSTPTTQNIIEWLEYFGTLPNHLNGLHLLPLEMEHVVHDISKPLVKEIDPEAKWQFIITHHKIGGFRQTVLHEGKVIFTRLIRPGKENSAALIAGNIEQEIINTIDYLRRLGLNDNESLNIFAIVSKELKNCLTTTTIRGKSLLLFTPYEINQLLALDSAAAKEDKFADAVISTIFATHKPILKLSNPREKSRETLTLAYKIATVAMFIIIPAITIYSGMTLFNIISLNKKIESIDDKKVAIEKEWKSVKDTGEYNIDDANKITDAISLRKKILDEHQLPLTLLEKIAEINADFITLQSFTWNYDKDYSAVGKKGKVSAVINLDFSTKDSNLDEMFKNYDLLSNSINKSFSDFTIDMSKLPEKITFDNKNANIPIQVKLASKDQPAGAPGSAPKTGPKAPPKGPKEGGM